jgi:hypothetical protein
MRGTDMVERTAPICPDALTLAVAFAYQHGMPRMYREGTTSWAFARCMAAGDITEIDLGWSYDGGDYIVISDYNHRAYTPPLSALIDGLGAPE